MEKHAKLYMLAAFAVAIIGFTQVLHYWESDILVSTIYLVFSSACAFIGLERWRAMKKNQQQQAEK
ncbi:hypothetical protein AAGS61_13445 [Lysinibacillus sp. KU-BSD001]|uniref:hypothetical protein n=1 Tax=Lysinibacillus sp. KU-BSD001 TaxID=3141328 RepID=UPI0036E0E40C